LRLQKVPLPDSRGLKALSVDSWGLRIALNGQEPTKQRGRKGSLKSFAPQYLIPDLVRETPSIKL
jgi:hypothetical protein